MLQNTNTNPCMYSIRIHITYYVTYANSSDACMPDLNGNIQYIIADECELNMKEDKECHRNNSKANGEMQCNELVFDLKALVWEHAFDKVYMWCAGDRAI